MKNLIDKLMLPEFIKYYKETWKVQLICSLIYGVGIFIVVLLAQLL